MGGTEFLRGSIVGAALILAVATSSPASSQTAQCDVGALDRTFGGGAWRVHACRDGASLVVVALADNPASPFFFFLGPEKALYGEGTGDPKWTKPAYEELAAMDEQAISALNTAVRDTARQRPPP